MNFKDTSYDQTKFRILMIHGFAGSGQEFRAKSSRIANRIVESITPQIIDEFPGGIEFLYPNGTLNLEAPIGFGGDIKDEDKADTNFYGWWHVLEAMSKCKGIDNSLSYIARYIHGRPIHAVVGFSQGAALGGTICSMLECANNPQRVASIRSQNLPVDAFLRLPGQKQLRFYIGIAGFRAYVYDSLYQFPLQTPSCHAIAKFDTMVEHSYTMDLARSFDGSETVHFYGSHYTPRDPATVDFMAAFAARHACGENAFLFPPPSPTSQADSDEDSVTARSDRSVRLFPSWVKSRRTNVVTVSGRLAAAPTIKRVRSFNW